MNVSPQNIIPISEARTKLGELTDQVSGQDYVVLTKGGNPKAALVDIQYLNRLQRELKRLYRKTYIDPTLLTFTREFTDAEIEEWQKEDSL